MVLVGSLGLNLVLAVAAVIHFRGKPASSNLGVQPALAAATPTPATKTNVVVRRQFFVWSEVESPDFAVFITNLRAINCPEPTIRDIIVAEVNQMYARKRIVELLPNDQEWWHAEPNLQTDNVAQQRLQALDSERRELLTSLLGPDWEVMPAAPTVIVQKALLPDITSDLQQALLDIERVSREHLDAYLAQRAGEPPQPAVLARIEREKRAELARTLSPQQLEEYLLRYSGTSQKLRADSAQLNATPEEFRRLFRLRDHFERQIESIPNDAANARTRNQLSQQLETAIRQELGTERYGVYKLNQDPAFGSAQSIGRAIEASPDAVLAIYEISRETEQERQRILRDVSLSSEDRDSALIATDAQKEMAIRKLLGEEGFGRYKQTQK